MSEVQKSKSVPKPVLGCFGLMGSGFLLVFIIAVVSSKPPSERAKDAAPAAFTTCKNAVRQRLKSPGTADFPIFDVNTFNLGEGKYKISSYVDSQNGFGAMVRTNFSCYAQTADGENFTVTNLETY